MVAEVLGEVVAELDGVHEKPVGLGRRDSRGLGRGELQGFAQAIDLSLLFNLAGHSTC
ncbi:hypothetical protein ACWDD9_11885 [Kitasatospora sp. NPDC001119]